MTNRFIHLRPLGRSVFRPQEPRALARVGSILKEAGVFIGWALILTFLFSGCIFIGYGNRTEKEEEKKIFGHLQGYNHRVKEAQICLVNAGLNPGLIDGIMDRSTRNAIVNFQKVNNLKVTGFIDFKTWRNLSEYKKAGKAVLDKKDQVKYYSSSSEGVKDIQKALNAAGFDPGEIDGKMGPKTKAAILKFQAVKALNQSGQIDSKTLEKLKRYFLTKN